MAIWPYFNLTKTDDIILHYLDIDSRLNEVRNIQNQVKREILGIFQDTDYFKSDTYDLHGQFFNFEDYEAFFPRNHRLSLERVRHREVVQEKLIELAEKLRPKINRAGMNIHLHWSRNHWTSLTFPTVFNFGYVTWLGIRFGKHQDEVMRLTSGAEEDEFLGFQKHACLQFAINGDTFETNLFHAVKNNAVDTPYLHDMMKDSNFKDKLIRVLQPLEGHPYDWVVEYRDTFNFENQKAKDFPQFYLDVDRDGYFSYLQYCYRPDDKRISEDNIAASIFDDFELYYPIYELVAKRY